MAAEVTTQVPGNIWKILVKPGEQVAEGDTLFIMEVMKTEVHHKAPVAGRIAAVNITEGEEGVDADFVAVSID